MRQCRAGFLVWLLCLLLPQVAVADVDDDIDRPTAEVLSVENDSLLLQRPAGLPQATGIVLLLADSLGPDARADAYADALLARGLLVAELRSDPGGAGAIAALARALAAQPRATGVAMLGFGAGGLLAAAAEYPFAARVLLYPGCVALADVAAPGGGPVLLLHGTEDAANTPADCTLAAAQLRQRGLALTRLEYAGAGYGWDVQPHGMERAILLPAPGQAGRVLAAPWPAMTELAAERAAQFLAAALPGPGR